MASNSVKTVFTETVLRTMKNRPNIVADGSVNRPDSPQIRPDSPQIRRKSWPHAPRSILKSRPTKVDLSRNSEESGIGSSSATVEPNKDNSIQLAELVEKQKEIQDEANSANSTATVVSARTVRKRRIAGIFQHYYPEGGWGYVVLICAFFSQFLATGLQIGFLILLPYAEKRYNATRVETGKQEFCLQ